MSINNQLHKITQRIKQRSAASRRDYLERMQRTRDEWPKRSRLSCGNIAHAFAACPSVSKQQMLGGQGGNIGIITAYNDMLSAHQPFEHFPAQIKAVAAEAGWTAQVAGGVPAMCDGVTQGQPGMELSLFSRDVITLSAAVGLSHNIFDSTIYLGVCDKIVPGMVMAVASFGHLPAIFAPAGPMRSGMPNDEKVRIRQQFARGEVGRDELLRAEVASYHSPGTCTFYGTANTNQLLLEVMGLQLPGAAFVNPDTDLRQALTGEAVKHAIQMALPGDGFTPAYKILDEHAMVNAMVALNASGGSTNLVIHLTAMAAVAGIQLDLQDFAEISAITPLLVRAYPNGTADVNHFHAAGGTSYVFRELMENGLLHTDVHTVAGYGLQAYTREPFIDAQSAVRWRAGVESSKDLTIIKSYAEPFMPTGGLVRLTGNLGTAMIKTSAVDTSRYVIEAPARVFTSQEAVKQAFEAGGLEDDCVVVVRGQGPQSNGMPELHGLSPVLGVMQERGQQVALLTDGRMSGASGKVPAAIHLSPEAKQGGPIACLRDGDLIRLDAQQQTLDVLLEADEWHGRIPAALEANDDNNLGRDLYALFRAHVSAAGQGASAIVNWHHNGSG